MLNEPLRAPNSDNERLLAIYRMIHVLNSKEDPEELLEAMLDMALEVVQAERGLVLLRRGEGDEFRVHVARNLEQETIRDAAEFSKNIVSQAGAGRAVLALDAGSDERLKQFKSVSMLGIRSVLCVPLRQGGEIIGVVYLDNRQGGAILQSEDLPFIEAFADHAAIALRNVSRRKRLRWDNEQLRVLAGERSEFEGMVGRAPAMQRLFSQIERFGPSDLPVLIQGESGTGKELVARALHRRSDRRQKRRVSVNCSTVASGVLESELFGHVRGAFTGADQDRQGLFVLAHESTLFLDEVGDMPLEMQAKLLRVLQEGEVKPVGGGNVHHVDVRIVAATNKSIVDEVRAGRFREDLKFRLHVLSIEVPPLRERRQDVRLLVDCLLQRIAAGKGRAAPHIEPAVLERLVRHPWPGNVRQLENMLKRMELYAEGGIVSEALIEKIPDLASELGEAVTAGPIVSQRDAEHQRIEQALQEAQGNKQKAAQMLGISRATLYRKLERHGIPSKGTAEGKKNRQAPRRKHSKRRGARKRNRQPDTTTD